MIAIAIDDEPPALKILQNYCQRAGEEVQLVKTFTNPREAVDYLDNYPVDLLFLDIRMPSISGIELCRSNKQNSMVIFTTAYGNFAVEGFNLNALDYLLKPFTFERFMQSLNKAGDYMRFLRQTHISDNNFMFVRSDFNLVKINFDDIIFIEGMDDYIRIHMQGKKSLVIRMTMKAFYNKLPPGLFIRIHRSYIVSVSRIKKIHKKHLFLEHITLPLSSSYEQEVMRILNIH